MKTWTNGLLLLGRGYLTCCNADIGMPDAWS